jgi:magnesium chelatase subunit D
VRALHGLLPELPLVTLPLNATEEMLLGGLDWGAALQSGARRLQPGLLARAAIADVAWQSPRQQAKA